MRPVRFDREDTVLSALARDGDGPPLVMLPGAMADAETWRPVVDHLDLPNPVIVLNRRGRAPSGPLGAGYSVRTEVDDLHHVLGELDGDVHLFGWSYGALIALEAAIARADLRSLILYEPVARPFAPQALAPLREAVDRGDLDRAVEIVNIVVSGFSPDDVAELRLSPAWDILRPLAEPLADELAAVNEHPPSMTTYADIDLPITLMLGEDNRGIPPYGTAFAEFAQVMAQAQVVELAGQGHLAHAQAPQQLADAIRDTIRQRR